jgi:hypothetical protein
MLLLACFGLVCVIFGVTAIAVCVCDGRLTIGDLSACGHVVPQGASIDVSPVKVTKRERVDVKNTNRPDHSYVRTVEIDARFADVDLVKLVTPVGEPNQQWQMVLASKRMPLADAQKLVAKGMHKQTQQFCRITRVS